MAWSPLGFGNSDELGDVVVRRAFATHISDEALGPRHAGFVKHLVEFHAGGADEGNALDDFVSVGGFADNHDFGGDRAIRHYGHDS